MKRYRFSIILTLALIGLSFIALPIIGIIFGTPLASIKTAFFDREIINSIVLTITAGILSTAIGLLIGIPLAYLIVFKNFKGKKFIESIIDIPVMIPHTAAGIALLTIFGTRGYLGKFFSIFGVRFVGTMAGIVIGMMFVSITFLINSAKEGFRSIDKNYIKVAKSLGANEFGTFFHVIIPLSLKDIVSGTIMSWARAISEFGAIIILAYHPMVAPVLVYERFTTYGLSYSKPIVFLITIISLVFFLILRIVSSKMKDYNRH
ncbi:molybdenum ABC transporter permease [candidate division TA06 bacterium]|uniref:Molybdenum ABC transporter permease n=1 Tax=candidate division TA06 bacterium TaxID=2250710 RepID=A0A660SCP8_UNCT6|nr:MAG: molybdenum ABC transporter permease [candidate division TA06 bacterium]